MTRARGTASRLLTWTAGAVWSSLSAGSRRLREGRRLRLPARVVSVGNIQVGGAGKTPLVALIARQAAERGILTAILCRGYGGLWEKGGGLIAPGEPPPRTAHSGDEAALLHDLAPAAWIGVGADRARQFWTIAEKVSTLSPGLSPPALVLLDDGFQNRQLEKDLEIVAITGAGRSEMLFRDWPEALRRAQLLVWTKGDQPPAIREVAPEVPMVRARFFLPEAVAGGGFGVAPNPSPDPSKARPIFLITGLADGGFARRTAEAAGYRIAHHLSFPDHARYAQAVLEPVIEKTRQQGLVLAVTGKDWVKLRELPLFSAIRNAVLVFEPELRFSEADSQVWERVLWER